MSDRVAKLEALLERVKSNSAQPRVRAPASVSAPSSDTRPRSAQPPVDSDEEEPMPLVRVAAAAPAVSISDTPDISITPFSETGEVTTLEFSDSEPPEALTDGDLEDMSSDLLESLPPAGQMTWSQSETAGLEEEPPISSQRPRLASGLEETLSVDDAEREAPLLTPPPESGPQEAAVPAMVSLGPTPEQIGEAVELEEPSHAPLELDVPPARPRTVPPKEELEALLAPQSRAGVYDEALLPPPQARDDLEAHDRRQASSPPEGEPAPVASGFPSEPATSAFVPAPPAAEAEPGFASGPEVHTAALPSGGAPEFRSGLPAFRPQSFLELLDASIALKSSN